MLESPSSRPSREVTPRRCLKSSPIVFQLAIQSISFLYLEERAEGLVQGFDDFSRRHPSSSAAVRERIVALERAGLMGDSSPQAFPERLGNFRLIERLGGGGMGIVFVAEEVSLGRRVALKLIRPEQIYFPQAKERFRREVESIAKLSHPGIVQVFSFAEDGGVPYFAMELVEGASLGDVLRHFAGTDPRVLSGATLKSALESISGKHCVESRLFEGSWTRACLEIARQVALALEHAHERGVVHRDIKPSNVMITLDGRARLLDFGLASRSGASKLTRSGAQLGSLPYMPPELVGGRIEDAGAATDVYSLGVTMYECLCLSLPFGGGSAAELALRISAGEYDSVRRRNVDVSLDAETICNVAMELDVARRYRSAGALAADLANVLERRPITARRAGPLVRVQRWTQRNPASATAAVLAALLLIGGPLGYGFLQGRAASKERVLNAGLRAANQTVLTTNTELAKAKSTLETKNVELSDSLVREASERARGERNFANALGAVDEMLATVGAEDLRDLPRLGPVRKKLLERALAFYGRLEQDDPNNPTLQREKARTSRSIADVLEDLGRSEEATAAFAKAADMARAALAHDPDSFDTRHLFSSNISQLARRHQQTGNLESANAGYLEALPVLEALLSAQPQNDRFAHDLVSVLGNLALLEMNAGREDLARPYLERSITVIRPVCKRSPNDPFFARSLSSTLSHLSQIRRNAGLIDQARVDMREAWSVLRDCLVIMPHDRGAQTEMLETSVNFGLDLMTHDPIEARSVLQSGFESGKLLVADFPEDPEARRGLAGVAINLGLNEVNQERWDAAEAALDVAVEQCAYLVAHEPSRTEFSYLLATAINGRSGTRLQRGQLDAAGADSDRAIAILEQTRKQLPEHSIVLASSASALMQRAEVELARGDWGRAVATMEEGLALGANRNDVSFQAFESYWNIARKAAGDPTLDAIARASSEEELVLLALDQLELALKQGFGDLQRLQTHPDYEALRANSRFQTLVDGLRTSAK